jgi:hypothetical protein
MKRTLIILLVILSTSCESKRDSCIRRYIDEQGYTYEDACEACDEAEENSIRR